MTRSTSLLMLMLSACGGDDDKTTAPPGTTPAPAPVVDAQRAVAVVDAAAPPTRAPDGDTGPKMSYEDRAFGDSSEWAMRWAVAINQPQAGAPVNPDWPCGHDVDKGPDGKVDTRYLFDYGGPATCFTPPDQILTGCPIRSASKGDEPRLDTVEEYAYDAGGHLVAMRRTNSVRVRRVLFTWEGDHLKEQGSDSNADGEPDEIYRYTYEGDTIRHEEQLHDGTADSWRTLGIFTLADGHAIRRIRPASKWRYKMASGQVMVTPEPGNRIELVWKDNRLIEAVGYPEKSKKPAERGTYRYDCPEAGSPAP